MILLVRDTVASLAGVSRVIVGNLRVADRLAQNRRGNLGRVGGIFALEVAGRRRTGQFWCLLCCGHNEALLNELIEGHTHAGHLRLGESLVLADSLGAVKVGVDAGVGLVQEVGLVRASSVVGRAGAGAEVCASSVGQA